MSKYHHLLVTDVQRLTADSVVIEFGIPEDLADTFAFRAGQYLGVRVDIDGEDVRRSYSICSEPSEGVLRIGVKHVPGGKFSTYANEVIKAGDTLQVLPPQGKFTHACDPSRPSGYVFFAAGSGITPVISLIKDILRNEPLAQVVLFFGNRTTDSIMFREEIEALKNIYLTRLSVHYILSKERQNAAFYNGRIDAEKCDIFSKVFFIPAKVGQFFICGPEEMIENVRHWLKTVGVPDDNVSFELFTTPTTKKYGAPSTEKKRNYDPAHESLVTARIDGNAIEFPLSYGGLPILEAAIQAGADAPFSCKGGVCCTCKAMLMEGEVEMDVVYGLEPDEIEDGYILTCQAHPRSETILVDYDV